METNHISHHHHDFSIKRMDESDVAEEPTIKSWNHKKLIDFFWCPVVLDERLFVTAIVLMKFFSGNGCDSPATWYIMVD